MTEHTAITLRIVPHIVASREAWEHTHKDGWRLKIGYVNAELQKAREALFHDEVYFPKMLRLMSFFKGMGILPNADWQWLTLGYNVEYEMWYPNDIESQEEVDYLLQDYFTELYLNEEWGFEQVKEEEIWAFCSKPEFVLATASMPMAIEKTNKAKRTKPVTKKPAAKPKAQQTRMF